MQAGTEQELERFFRQVLPAATGPVLAWAGEDGALLEAAKEQRVTVLDMLVEGVHFSWQYSSPAQLARKALAVNLSDLAACGAEPVSCMLGLAVSRTFLAGGLEEFYQGLADALRKWEIAFAGGDFSLAPVTMLTVSAEGYLAAGQDFWSRSGARPGDQVYLTGTPGLAALGLDILQGKREPFPAAVERQLDPPPPLPQARWLRENRVPVTACMDNSDGLATSLHCLARESGRLFVVEQEQIPQPAVSGAEEYALGGGEDYELLFTTPLALDPQAFLETTGTILTRIGRVVNGEGVQGADGEPLPCCGYDHLAGETDGYRKED